MSDHESPKLINTIVCDDVRIEVGNKISYMGIYRNEIIINGPFPFRFSKLCFIQKFKNNQGTVSIRQILLAPSGKELAKIEINNIAQSPKEKNFLEMQAIFDGLVVEEVGEYRMKTYFNDNLDDSNIYKFFIKQLEKK